MYKVDISKIYELVSMDVYEKIFCWSTSLCFAFGFFGHVDEEASCLVVG